MHAFANPWGLAPGYQPPSSPPPAGAVALELDQPRVWHLPGWGLTDDAGRLKMLREIVENAGRDPRIAALAASICRQAGCPTRDYRRQAAAILRWVQPGGGGGLAFHTERDERLQDPLYTVTRARAGDCDDFALLAAALMHAIRLPVRFVLAGRLKGSGQPIRYVEGTGPAPRAIFTHIYLTVGPRPFDERYVPGLWLFAEPTVPRAPLGWDVFQGDTFGAGLPELGNAMLAGELTIPKVTAAVVVGTLTTIAGALALEAIRKRKRR